LHLKKVSDASPASGKVQLLLAETSALEGWGETVFNNRHYHVTRLHRV
jgi:hypothetical protein